MVIFNIMKHEITIAVVVQIANTHFFFASPAVLCHNQEVWQMRQVSVIHIHCTMGSRAELNRMVYLRILFLC